MADKTPRKGRPKARAKIAPAKCIRADRQRRVWELRLRNKSIGDIVATLKAEGFTGPISEPTVWRDINEHLEEQTRAAKATKAQMRQQTSDRLDEMMRLLWEKAAATENANAMIALRALEQMRAIEADRARLFGLHEQEDEIIVPVAPAESTTSTTLLFRSMTPDEVAEQRAKQTAKSAGSLPAE